MTTSPAFENFSVQTLRAALRADLKGAMKERDSETVDVLRNILAAVDNAEAIDVVAPQTSTGDGPIAGASVGLGSAEADRKRLLQHDVERLFAEQIDEYEGAATQFEEHGQAEHAQGLRRKAAIVRAYLGKDA